MKVVPTSSHFASNPTSSQYALSWGQVTLVHQWDGSNCPDLKLFCSQPEVRSLGPINPETFQLTGLKFKHLSVLWHQPLECIALSNWDDLNPLHSWPEVRSLWSVNMETVPTVLTSSHFAVGQRSGHLGLFTWWHHPLESVPWPSSATQRLQH
jgi:hypothetical protein